MTYVKCKSGEVKLIRCYTKNHVDMRLVRKYSKYTRISSFRKGLLDSKKKYQMILNFLQAEL